MPDPPSFIHDAFISYSRKDTPFAAALERALKRYRPPKGLPAPQRRLNVFRDAEDFTGVEYSEAVARHLRGARKLIVVCSPHARQSRYVNDEIRLFAESHAAADIVSVIVAGVPNNETAPGDEAAAFPAALCERLAVPLASDYRGFDARWHRPGSGRFRGAWYKLLADILDCGRAEVEERERRRRLRQRLVWGGTSLAVASALAVAVYTAGARGRTARSNELAGRATSIVRSDPELAALLALEAANQAETPAAVSALRVALAQLPDLQVAVGPADLSTPRAISFAPGGRRVAIADATMPPRVVDLESGTVSDPGASGTAPVENLRWSPDGTLIAALDKQGNTIVSDTATGNRVAETDGELYWRPPPGTSGVPAAIVRDGTVRVVELEKSGAWRILNEVPDTGGSLSPDAGRLATLDENTRLTVTDLESGRTIDRVVDGPAGAGLFWSPKGRYLVAHALTGFVVLDARSLATVFSIDAGNEIIVEDLSVSFDETLLAGTDRNGSTTLWNIRTREKSVLSGQETRAYRPVFSSDGRFLSVVYANGRADLFDGCGSAPTPLTTFDATAGDIVATAFTPDARALIVQYEKGRVAFWFTDRWRPEHRLPLDYGGRGENLANVRVTADGALVMIQNGQTWRGWNTVSGTEVPGPDGASSLRPLPQGPATPSQLHRLSHEADVRSEAISADGACILTASAYRMASGGAPANANVVRLWDAGSATLLRQWRFDGFGPDAAFFGGQDRIVALHEGAGYVYRSPLCEPIGALRELAGKRVSRGLTAGERSMYLGEGAPAADAPAGTGVPGSR